MFKTLEVDVTTRWRTAHNKLLTSSEYQEDEELQKLPSLDVLLAFEDYSRVLEREFEENMRRAQVEKVRRERKAREAFKELLKGLVDAGKIKARSKWKEVYPLFKEDKRYLDMLGNPGSNPLELFWDEVDRMDERLERKVEVVRGAAERWNAKNVKVPVKVKEEEGEDVKMGDVGEVKKDVAVKMEEDISGSFCITYVHSPFIPSKSWLAVNCVD